MKDQPRGICVELGRGSTAFADIDGFPDVGSVDSKVTHVASMVTNVFEYGTKAFSYAYVVVFIYLSYRCMLIRTIPIIVNVPISVTCVGSRAAILDSR